MPAVTLTPYLPGQGPTVEVDTGSSPTVHAVDPDGTRTLVFQGTCYRPAPGSTERERAGDVVAYALAYVERPEEFDRQPEDLEQLHAAWWRRHGDALTACTDDQE